jgi:hypothetical protein
VDGADYTTLEEQFGIPPGQGQTVNTLVNNAMNDLNTSGIEAFLHQLG